MEKSRVGDRVEEGDVENVGGREVLEMDGLEQGHGQSVAEAGELPSIPRISFVEETTSVGSPMQSASFYFQVPVVDGGRPSNTLGFGRIERAQPGSRQVTNE
jgi:hypothetical protein